MADLLAALASVVPAASEPNTKYATKIAHALEPGQSFTTVDGSRYRVLSKYASVGGIRLRLAGAGFEKFHTLASFAALEPLSPAAYRIASFVHRILAFDKQVDAYVKEAIKAAGLPVDASVNWAKWLTGVYAPTVSKLTKDTDLIDDGIRQVVFQELFEKRILSPDAPGYHFDESRIEGDKPLDKKVSAFLSMVFKNRTSEFVDYIKRALGPGTGGEMGRAQTESLYRDTDESDSYEANLPGQTDHSFTALEDEDDVRQFMAAFDKYVARTERPDTTPVLQQISQDVLEGMDQREIMQHLVSLKFKGQGRDGVRNYEALKPMWRKWVALIRRFATSPEHGWNDAPVARAIAAMAERLAKNEPSQQKQRTSGLILAAVNPNVEQQLAYQPRQSQPQAVSPAPQQPAPQEEGFVKPEEEEEQPVQPQNGVMNSGGML